MAKTYMWQLGFTIPNESEPVNLSYVYNLNLSIHLLDNNSLLHHQSVVMELPQILNVYAITYCTITDITNITVSFSAIFLKHMSDYHIHKSQLRWLMREFSKVPWDISCQSCKHCVLLSILMWNEISKHEFCNGIIW